MGNIHILDESLINKIAAGEVIERPASVVKELVENSIDANADRIIIEVTEGGKSLIRITDNGTGMLKEDVPLAIQRHTTSKISKIEDLYKIKTLGFRGEALASIAAVSKLTIKTRTANAINGTLLIAEGGKINNIADIGCPVGTIVEVKDLFYNTPVRKKYLKTIIVEFNHIAEIVIRYSLANTDKSFRLVHNNKLVFFSPKTRTLFDKIITVYGKEIAKNLIPVHYKQESIEVTGYISKPSLTRNDKQQQSIYINGRYIKNNIITKAVYDAYHSLLFSNRHPIFILMLAVDPKKVDVNIHPTKRVVKLLNEDIFYNAVYNAVNKALTTKPLIFEPKLVKRIGKIKEYKITKDEQSVLIAKDKEIKKIAPSEKIGPVIILGQINKTYIIAESSRGLLIVDQHAAQERIIYEQFLKDYKNKGVKVQRLIRPKLVELTLPEANVVRGNLELLKNLGFHVEDYGKNTFIIRTIPAIFDKYVPGLFKDLIKELSFIDKKVIDKIKEEKIIMFACKKAIKAGEELTTYQMEKIIKDLENTEQPYTCPHGRPTLINISLQELERKFRRK